MPRCDVSTILIGETELHDKVLAAICRSFREPAIDGYRFTRLLSMVYRREEVLLDSKTLLARYAFTDNPDGFLGFGLTPLLHQHRRINDYDAKRNADKCKFRPVRKQSSHLLIQRWSAPLERSHNRHPAAWTLFFWIVHRDPEPALATWSLIDAPLDYRVRKQQSECNKYREE